MRSVREGGEQVLMGAVESLVLGAIALALLVYLVISLLDPERF